MYPGNHCCIQDGLDQILFIKSSYHRDNNKLAVYIIYIISIPQQGLIDVQVMVLIMNFGYIYTCKYSDWSEGVDSPSTPPLGSPPSYS